MWAKTVQLRADELSDNGQGNIVASGHVVARYEGLTVNTSILNYSKKLQYLSSSGSVTMIYKDRKWQGSDLSFWVSSDHVVMNNFLTITSINAVGSPMLISSDYVDKAGNFYHGGHVQMTTCLHTPPHYFFEAERFELYPQDQVVGHEVWMRVGGVPVFYSPYYAFVEGYQHPILLIPAVGASYSEGAYFKETLVYDWNENLRSRTYLDFMERKGIGVGSKLAYGPSSVYGYYIGPNDHVLDWTQRHIDFSGSWEVGVRDRHMTQPNGFREDETRGLLARNTPSGGWSMMARDQQGAFQQAQLTYKFQRPEEKQDWLLNVEQYPRTAYQTQTLRQSVSRPNAEEIMTWRDLSYPGVRNQQLQDIGSLQFSPVSKFDWDILYKRQSLTNGDESTILPRVNLTVRPPHDPLIEEWGVRMNTEMDLDGSGVTWDERVDLVEMLPEFRIKTVPQLLAGGLFSMQVGASRIHERHDAGVIRNFQTERIAIHNVWSRSLIDEAQFQFRYEGIYDQYLYGSGDKQYSLGHRLFWGVGQLNSLHSSWTYQQRRRGGYTPFYFDDIRTNEERLGHQLVWPIDSTLHLTVDDGYNVIDSRFEDEVFRLRWDTTVSLSAQVLWSRDPQSGQGKSLQTSWQWQDRLSRSLSLVIDHDLSTARTRTGWLRGAWKTEEPEPWILDAMIRWSAERQALQTDRLRIVRDFGCINYAYEWDGIKLEHRFIVEIPAIPNASLGLSAGENGAGFWGPGEQDATR